MARRIDVNSAMSTAIENTSARHAGSHGINLPVGTSGVRGGASGTTPAHLPASVQAKLLLLQGKLLRRDRTFLTWKWRDFYLEQQRLQYFNEKGVRKGEILITSTTPIVIRLVSEPKPFGFLLFIKDEKLTLAAATAQDRQKWIDVFTELFHANVEDFQSHKATGGGTAATGNGGHSSTAVGVGGNGGNGEKQEKKRTRPTFLPIPDMSEDEGGMSLLHLHHHHNHLHGPSGTAAAATATPQTSGNQGGSHTATTTPATAAVTVMRPHFGRRQSEGSMSIASSTATVAAMSTPPATTASSSSSSSLAPLPPPLSLASTCAAATKVAHPGAAAAVGDNEEKSELPERRSFYRNSDGAMGLEISIPRSKFIALKEQYSNVTFPRTLANGDVLVGVGPLVRRMGWTDERILAVGMYVDADAAAKELMRFYGRTLKSVRGDQAFYDFVVQHSKFRRSIVVTSRKRVSKSVLNALLHDEIAPRLSGSTDALHTFLGFIEKSLRKAESMMLRIHPEVGRLEFRLRGQQYPPIASSLLCQCIQAVFFDVNSIQQDAKRRLIERFPLLWGMEELLDDGIHPAVAPGDREGPSHELENKHNGSLSESDDDDEDDEGDDEDDDSGGAAGSGDLVPTRRRGSTSAGDQQNDAVTHPIKRNLSMKEKLDELDEQEHELMRRESRSLGVRFGPIVDKDSNAQFKGDLLVDGSTLLGTWSHKITYTVETEAVERFCVVSVGLYAESGGASETLLKYKGLSVGSILQDPDFFARFADGAFAKHLVFKVQQPMPVAKLVDYFTARVRRRGSGAGMLSSGADSGRSSDAKVRQLLEKLEDKQVGTLRPQDELHVTIAPDSRLTLAVNRPPTTGSDKDDGEEEDKRSFPPVAGISVAAAPFSSIFQGIFYGYHTLDPASRTQLMERLPSLLDLARDDLAQTYYDEIQVLKENYKRQLPEFRLKAGYMLISFEKKIMAKNAEGVKEQTTTPSKWSKRWCRLDGTTFSYFAHKRSKKPRDIVDLTTCQVSEITASSTVTGLAPFAVDKGNVRPSIRIGIAKPNGEILALKTESIFEGVEWLESLVEASDVVSRLAPQTSDGDGDGDGEDTDRGAIETSGGGGDGDGDGGDADESSGVVDGEDENDGNVVEEDRSGGVRAATSLSVAAANPASDLVATATQCGVGPVVKHGSLVSWILEDSRHAFIFVLLLVIACLITSQQPVLVQKVAASCNGLAEAATANSSSASPSTSA